MYLDANLMETAYAIEHISKLGNVVVRAGCGEFEGERNVCVDVGLGHGYTLTRRPRILRVKKPFASSTARIDF